MPLAVTIIALTENPPTVVVLSWAGILDWRKGAACNLQSPLPVSLVTSCFRTHCLSFASVMDCTRNWELKAFLPSTAILCIFVSATGKGTEIKY